MKSKVQTRKIHSEIIKDCFRYYFVTVFLNVMAVLVGKITSIYSTSMLGGLADDILYANQAAGFQYIKCILLCILIATIVPTIFTTMGEVTMTGASLSHGYGILRRYLGKEYESAQRLNASEVQYRLEDDQTDLGITWVLLSIKAVTIPVLLLFLLYQSIRLCGWYTLVILGVSMVRLLVPVLVKKKWAKYDMEERTYKSKQRGMENEMIKQSCQVYLLGMGKALIARLMQAFEEFFECTFKRQITMKTIMESVLASLDQFCVVIILVAGAVGVANGALTAGAIAVMLGYFYQYNAVFVDAEYMIKNTPILNNLVERITVFYADEEAQDGNKVESPFYMKLEDLCFSFGEKEVFHKISGEIKSNQKTAIVGENGTGKSTLVRILCGLYENYKGKFTINGQELKSIQSDYWRKQIAYVEQNPYLFEGTVRENIHLGNPNATEHEVDHVLEVLQITNLAQRLCGNEQENLSGGERQKVAIARALLKNASVLVLDEPGNHLDAEALVWLNDFIRSYEGTLIYISHDKESVGNNDYVIAL